MKTTKLYIVIMFAAMQTGLVFSMDQQAAHQAIVAYSQILNDQKSAHSDYLDSSRATFSDAQKRYADCARQEKDARENLVREYPQYVSDILGTVFVHIDGGYAVTSMQAPKYVKSQNKSRPFTLAAAQIK